ncbi:hypothetical protein BAMA111019_04535 [Bacillus manliponensis]
MDVHYNDYTYFKFRITVTTEHVVTNKVKLQSVGFSPPLTDCQPDQSGFYGLLID